MKTFGYYLGLLLLLGDAVYMVRPRLKFDLWERTMQRCASPYLNDLSREYTGLSDRALRWFYASYMVMGAVILWLSKGVRD